MEKTQEKAARKAAREASREATRLDAENAAGDPDLAGITAGPQPERYDPLARGEWAD